MFVCQYVATARGLRPDTIGKSENNGFHTITNQVFSIVFVSMPSQARASAYMGTIPSCLRGKTEHGQVL